MFGVTIDHMEQENGERWLFYRRKLHSVDIVGLCIGTRAITEIVQEKWRSQEVFVGG